MTFRVAILSACTAVACSSVGHIGADGAAGAPENAGNAGSTSPAGASGTAGGAGGAGGAAISGAAGATSASGGAGSTGTTGAAGQTGTAGGTGNAGTTGTAGAAGTAGKTGAAGSTGAAGTTGAAGKTGAAGSAGTAGAAGKAGAAGSTGAAGAAGNTGVAGQAGSTGAAGQATATIGGIFSQPEPWTEDVSKLAKDARSDKIIAALGGWGGGRLQIDFSIPLFFADATTPRQTITARAADPYCYRGTDCDPVPLQMPLPANGNLEGSQSYTCDTTYKTDGQGDCHVLVVETSQHKLYELYNATMVGTAYTALGAFIWDLTKAYPDNLRGDQCTSADAAGFPMAALLPTADEVAAGAVAHALRFILPNPSMKAGVYVHPATHAGGPESTDPNAPPYGVRFRLKASFDESKFDAGERVILHAMKTYGMLLSDGGTIALTFADDRTTTAKWASQGITALSFAAITVDDFEVVDLAPEIALTDNCVRNP